MYYLLKSEPAVYSFAQLQNERETLWDGVTNPQAVMFLRQMQKGDQLIIYHTGDERRAMGTASVLGVDATDPKVPLVRIKVGKPLARPSDLPAIKQSKLFADSPLLKQGRLSVVPLTQKQFEALVDGKL